MITHRENRGAGEAKSNMNSFISSSIEDFPEYMTDNEPSILW